jgi:hypothetical protein
MTSRTCPDCGLSTNRRRCPDCDTRTLDDVTTEFFERRDSGGRLLPVVGESFYQSDLRAAKRRYDERLISVVLKAEPSNEVDPNAVQVCDSHSRAVLGYLDRRAAKQFQKTVIQFGEKSLDALLIGGTRSKPSYGLYVDATPVRALYDADSKRAARRAKREARKAEARRKELADDVRIPRVVPVAANQSEAQTLDSTSMRRRLSRLEVLCLSGVAAVVLTLLLWVAASGL